eukprot:SAG31_NODE_17388_length_672_cov_1.364747_1_plen_66_part_10
MHRTRQVDTARTRSQETFRTQTALIALSLSPLQHSISQKMHLTASLFFVPLCAMMAAVRAGETETQ